MKKYISLSLLVFSALFLFTIYYSPSSVYADVGPKGPSSLDYSGYSNPVNDIFGQITAPSQLQPLTSKGGAGGISFVVNQAITLIYTFATVIFVFMLLFSALQWIMSGGEKEAVGKARARLTYAIIGIILLAFTFVILRVLGNILGFNFFG